MIITESGKPVARVIRENTDKIPLREPLEPLIGKGMIEYPVNPINREMPKPLKTKGKPVSQIVMEQRR